MSESDFQKELKKITRQATQERKQEIAQERAKKREANRKAKANYKIQTKKVSQESTKYTAEIIAELEYDGVNIPSKEKLAEDLGHTIMRWADQKSFYAINPKESIPNLISVEVDIK